MTHEGDRKGFLGSFRETLLAYTFDLAGLAAGFIVASQLGVFKLAPWAIALYPAVVSAKGVTNGVFSGRLAMTLHLGTVYPKFFGNTATFHRLFSSLVVMTLLTSVVMSLASMVFGSFFWGITQADFAPMLLIVVSTMAIGFSVTLLTTKVAFVSFKKGLDPDIVVYPIMSTVADLFVTFCYVLVLNLFFVVNGGTWVLAAVFLGQLIFVLCLISRNIRSIEFVKTIKESLKTMVFVAFIVNVTGTFLKGISGVVESRKEIYTLYPALIDIVGDVGAVVGSTATTKLALGLLKPSVKSLRNHAKIVLSAWFASLIMFLVLAVFSLAMNGALSPHALANVVSILLITNGIAVAIIVFFTFALSILTFTKGLDPDNFVIPVESTLADSLASMSLLVALLLIMRF